MTATLGIDPGHGGAACLVDARGLPVACWAWHRLERKRGAVYRLDSGTGSSVETRTLAGVGLWLARHVEEVSPEPRHLAVEGLYMPDDLDRARSVLELARTVGWLTAGLLEDALSVVQPTAAVWRPAILDVPPNCGSDKAERAALLRWRAMWRGTHLRTDPHVAESACIAAWAIMNRRQQTLLSLLPAR